MRSLPLLLALVIVTAACATAAVSDLEVVDLAGVDQLADAFNQVGTIAHLNGLRSRRP